MTDIETLASSLLANFRTIRLPADALPTQPNLEPTDWWATTKALRAEKRAVYDLRNRLRRVLIQHRYRFIDRLEPDPEGGWRIHIFVLDEDALLLLNGIDGKRCEPGDPVDFDPEGFVIERLRELEWCEP
jgi:hypothetical protein